MSIRAFYVFCVFHLLLTLSLQASAKTIHVPADQPTIQAAIVVSVNGDTVLVSAGTYYENINFIGKAITVTSASGPGTTILDGSKTYNLGTVTFDSAEALSSIISGFTIQNQSGPGVVVYGASPTISGNVITGNSSTICGGVAISVFQNSAALIQGNLISGNLSGICGAYPAISTGQNSAVQVIGNAVVANNGGGVSIYQANASINVSQNTISLNRGPGLFIYSGSGPVSVVQNVITDNQGTGLAWYQPPMTAISNTIADNAPGGCCGTTGSEISAPEVDGTVVLENNLIVATGTAPAFYCGHASNSPKLLNNDIFSSDSAAYGGACADVTGSNGNISADPLFVSLLGDNFHIQSASPVISAGNASGPKEPKTDIDGDPRTSAGLIDIGADQYTATQLLTLSSGALHFGPQDVGTVSSAQILTLTSTSGKATAIVMIATGTNYSQTNNCGKSLAAGASCQISVRFSPAVGGTVEGAMGIFTNATANPLVVSLIGTGLAPKAQTPCCYYFYGQVIGTSSSQTQQLTNTGDGPLTITSIAFSGSPDFVQANNCPIAPNTLAPGSSCDVTVTFSPTIVGYEYGTLTFTDNAQPGSQSVNLNGSSVSAGVPVLNPTSLTFPTVLVGQSSAPQSVTLSNSGTGAMGIQQIFTYGDFPQTNNCPATLAVGANCVITVTYTPSQPGNAYGNLIIFTDSAYFEASAQMTGTGQAPVPTIGALSVASVPAGSSDTQVTITGTGFVYGSQVLWNGVALPCCAYLNGNTQFIVTIPSSTLTTAGTDRISIFTPAPGGGTSNSLPFTVYAPVNYAVKSAAYSYRNISGTNLQLYPYAAAQITSPFAVQFGGGSFTSLTVGAGGTISFNGFASEYNDTIPTTQTPMIVAPFWSALYPFGTGDDNNVFWDVTGVAPNRELVVEWRDVPYCCSYSSSNTIRFQVVFFEGTGNVLFNYADTIFGDPYSSYDNGAAATSGIQVAPGVGTLYSFNQPLLKSQTSLLWYPGSPTATLSTGTLGFGYHQIGTRSQIQKLTLTNGSLAELLISAITIDNPDFTQTNTCGASLAPHKSCVIRVRFAPTQPFAETATLTIQDNATNAPQTASLAGIGAINSIVVFPIIANFGSVTVGSTNTLPVVLANAANKVLTIQSIAATPGLYTQTNNCGGSLASGASCIVSVTFAPLQPGNVTGKLSMALNGKPATNQVKLVGSGR